jgi:catechol 2,3-dioxygenase-like lactoylglutathione lyase family enzyme
MRPTSVSAVAPIPPKALGKEFWMEVSATTGRGPATSLTAALHHLVIATPNPTALAEFYRVAMRYGICELQGRIFATGRDRRLLFVPGKAKTLQGAGFAVADREELKRLRLQIEERQWPYREGASPLLSDSISVCDPDGTEFIFGVAEPEDTPISEAPARLARLQHVVMSSRDPERVARFFIEVLGFRLSDNVVDAQGQVTTSFLRCSHEHHSFAVFKASEDRFDHHCYETKDWNQIRDWCDHMARNHIPVQWGPGRHGPGNNLFMFVHDTDGNWVEISSELELVSEERPVGRWPHEERTLNSWGRGLLRS